MSVSEGDSRPITSKVSGFRRFRAEGVQGFRVQGSGFRVQGLGFRSSEFRGGSMLGGVGGL